MTVGPVTAAGVLAELRARGQTLAVAESLTGGLLAAAFVAVAGASTVFRGGLVVYATDLKASLADVPTSMLAARGPVDPEVAGELARGARRRCGADWALATTGVAGPDPQAGQPVGRAYVAVADPAAEVHVRELTLSGDRAAIRAECVTRAVALLAAALESAH